MTVAIGGFMMLFAGMFSYCILMPFGLQDTNFGIFLMLFLIIVVLIMGLMLLTISSVWGNFLQRFSKQKQKFMKAMIFLADLVVTIVAFCGVIR